MSWIACDIPEANNTITTRLCDKCGCHIDEIKGVYSHANLCIYFQFAISAPDQGLVEVQGSAIDTPYIKVLLDSLGIQNFLFKTKGSFYSIDSIFVPQYVASAINLYHKSGDYAGLTLEDFIRRMSG